jgi:Pentapeptide repeats (8 copies)
MSWSILCPILIVSVLALLYFGLKGRNFLEWQTIKNLPDGEQRARLTIEFVKTVAQILGGALFILTVVIAYMNYRISQEKNATDLFTKAIEQLGSDKLEVRVGGIYALERIARESEKDHGPIIEVLTAYVRAYAPWPPEDIAEARRKRPWARERPGPKDYERLLKPKDNESFSASIMVIPKLDDDIQAVLTVIGRSSRIFEKGEAQRLDFTRTDLRGVDVREARLEGANFSGARLEGASLWQAHLEGADLSGATGLTQEQIDAAYCDDKTKLPPNFKCSGKKEPRP